MPQDVENHDWVIPVPFSESDEDTDQWGQILVSLFEEIDHDVVIKAPLADRPAAGDEGRWFLATDQNPPTLSYDDGTDWVAIGSGGDADTLDDYDSTDFAVLAEDEDITGDWDVVGSIRITDGQLRFDYSEQSFVGGLSNSLIYATEGVGDSYPFSGGDYGCLILQPRTSSARDVILATGSSTPMPVLIADRNQDVRVPNGNLDLEGNEAVNARVENRTSDPSSPSAGREWLRTDL